MTKEQIARLFVAFQQAHVRTSVEYGGTGLGLFISRNLVQSMGGDIIVESEYGSGSRFSFDVQFDISETSGASEPLLEFPNLRGKHMLLADDIDVNRLVITALMEDTGIEITEVKDGNEAIELFHKSPLNHYSIIFMDTRMPITDGYETTRRIRALQRIDAKTVPIISMSANAFQEDIDAAMAAGMTDKLIKPIVVHDLATILNKYMT